MEIKVLLLLFIFKLMDNSFNTCKNVFMIKGKHFWSATCGSISYIFCILMTVMVAQHPSTIGVVVIFVATFCGAYFPQIISDRFEKDKTYEYMIWFDDVKSCIDIIKQFDKAGIKVHYKEHKKRIIINSKNRNQSKTIEEIIYGKYKSLKIIELKEYVKVKKTKIEE